MTFAEIAETFQSVDAQTRLELLLDYAHRLPDLPEEYHALRDAGLGMVHECQSPVFLNVRVDGGVVRAVGDVPEEAPTAPGFVSILLDAFDGADPETVAEAPPDALRALGLAKLIGMQRTRGLSAIYLRFRTEADRQA
jgi:cysteine desulfuration protein SufE